MAERALSAMVERASSREASGRPLAGHGVVAAQIAEARMAIEQARLLVLKTAWLTDDAIQVHGGAGVSDDFPLAAMYAAARTLRIADGPDEVHMRTVARAETHRSSR